MKICGRSAMECGGRAAIKSCGWDGLKGFAAIWIRAAAKIRDPFGFATPRFAA